MAETEKEIRMDMDAPKGHGPALPVMGSIKTVVENSRWVFFHPEQLDAAVAGWGHSLKDGLAWEHPCHYFDGTEESVRWIFVLDILNHCFWPDRNEAAWTVEFDGSTYSGYWGLAAGLKRAMAEGFPITDADFLADLGAEELRRIFRGAGRLPLFEDRLSNLRESGRILRLRWGGDIVRLIEASNGSGTATVLGIVSSFPSFRDQASYQGHTVYFWKRAQLFVADLHLAFQGSGWGRFQDIERLTAFADYKLPQVLRELGVISYRPDLAGKIDSFEELRGGSEEEIEIRAITIHACEELKRCFQRTGRTVTSVAVDNWLWQLGQLEPFRRRPYHRCRTIFY
jgi:hypothetical protein